MKYYTQVKNVIVASDLQEGTNQLNKILYDMQLKEAFEIHSVKFVQDTMDKDLNRGRMYQVSYQVTERSEVENEIPKQDE